jgi:menaquinol-cytochrome c reductase iron-sulfur subunit
VSKLDVESVGRRKFLGFLSWFIGGIIALALGIPLIGYLISPGLRRKKPGEWAEVGELAAFAATGEPQTVQYTFATRDSWLSKTEKKTLYLKIKANEKPVALSPVCTHLGCGVSWDEKQKKFFCPCHGGVYDAEGKVIAGPPPHPLDRLEVKVEDGKLFVRG